MDALLSFVDRVDLYVCVIFVMIAIDGPGNDIFDIWGSYGTERDDITSTYWHRPSCGGGNDTELGSMISCLNFDLGDDSVVNMSARPCPLCPKAVFIKMTSKLLMVDKELNSAGVEALLGWWESVTSNLVARDAHDLCNRVACIF